MCFASCTLPCAGCYGPHTVDLNRVNAASLHVQLHNVWISNVLSGCKNSAWKRNCIFTCYTETCPFMAENCAPFIFTSLQLHDQFIQ